MACLARRLGRLHTTIAVHGELESRAVNLAGKTWGTLSGIASS